ncbi:dethiobiotin synthase [Wenyingzhuangia sp. IMCC45533]
MNDVYFVTGISTDVGKTVVSAILVEALKADYWKPIQSGDLDFTDTDKVRKMVKNKESVFYKSTYELTQPMSPHAAAKIDNVVIDIDKIIPPQTENTLIIEGAGGLLVPLNDKNTILDIIPPKAKVVLVSKNYLGSINHTLMSIEILRSRGFEPLVVFNGAENKSSEEIVEKLANVKALNRIPMFNFDNNRNMISCFLDNYKF